jgi:polysaccharide deacetylase 2 family uncharacterized protein YibQ
MSMAIQKSYWPTYLVRRYRFLRLLLCSPLFLLSSFAVLADNPPTLKHDQNPGQSQPAISIIIDDLGYLKKRDTRAIQLPGSITYAFLPHTPHAKELAILAHKMGKEVMLHQPMESQVNTQLGPGGLMLNMTHDQFAAQLKSNLDAIPYVVGINNHMGSLLTQHPGHMRWLMQEVRNQNNLYLVDSYTTKTSILQKIAAENWIPNLRRDVFLDSDRDPAKIRMHFRRLLKIARKTGIALAIGHPYPETMAVLEEELPKLSSMGIQLIPVSKLLDRDNKRFKTWRASLSR